MVTINLILSLVSMVGAVLVARGYLPHIPLRSGSPTAWLARAFVTASGAYFVRTLYRDVYLTLAGSPPEHVAFSVALNLVLIGSEYCALRARYESIPPGERSKWGVLSAPWYPEGPVIARLGRRG